MKLYPKEKLIANNLHQNVESHVVYFQQQMFYQYHQGLHHWTSIEAFTWESPVHNGTDADRWATDLVDAAPQSGPACSQVGNKNQNCKRAKQDIFIHHPPSRGSYSSKGEQTRATLPLFSALFGAWTMTHMLLGRQG